MRQGSSQRGHEVLLRDAPCFSQALVEDFLLVHWKLGAQDHKDRAPLN